MFSKVRLGVPPFQHVQISCVAEAMVFCLGKGGRQDRPIRTTTPTVLPARPSPNSEPKPIDECEPDRFTVFRWLPVQPSPNLSILSFNTRRVIPRAADARV